MLAALLLDQAQLRGLHAAGVLEPPARCGQARTDRGGGAAARVRGQGQVTNRSF